MMKPVILLNCDVEDDRFVLRANYADAVMGAGGIPLVLPAAPAGEDLPSQVREGLDRADGVLLVGGDDYDPALWGEPRHARAKPISARREAADLSLARAALGREVPVLGICAGAQLLALAAGGACIQHLGPADAESIHAGGSRHGLIIEPGSLLARILDGERGDVNSFHHQAVDPRSPGTGFTVVGRAAPPWTPAPGTAARDFVGAVEAIEASGGRPVLGVQWHPERMLGETAGHRLFDWLVEASSSREGRRS